MATNTQAQAASAAAHDDHDSPAYIRKQIGGYIVIGVLLLLATGLTVLAAEVDLPPAAAVYLGLAIAGFKGFLVAAYFMHLADEKKIIYASLILTVFMFFAVLLIPIVTELSKAGGISEMTESAAAAAEHEGGGHH